MSDDKKKQISLLEKMIFSGKEHLSKRIANNGKCKSTENTQQQIERWELEISKLQAK